MNFRSTVGQRRFFVWTALMISFCVPGRGAGSPDRSHQLHVFVFAEKNDPATHAPGYDIRALSDALLPLQMSRAAVNSPKGEIGGLASLPGRIRYLDVHTIQVDDRIGRGVEQAERTNPLCELDYRLRFNEWQEDSYTLDLNVTYRDQTWNVTGLTLDPSVTSLVGLNGKPPIGFALTRLDRAGYPVGDPLPEGVERSRVSRPRILRQTPPKMPRNLPNRNSQEVVRLLSCIGRDGRVRPNDFILLDCSHPSYARETIKAFAAGWLFEPARVARTPVAVNVTLEVVFMPPM